jgi:hypothetical protein
MEFACLEVSIVKSEDYKGLEKDPRKDIESEVTMVLKRATNLEKMVCLNLTPR